MTCFWTQVHSGILGSLVIVLSLGCGRSDLAIVSGRVTLDGKPVGEASIEFLPISESSGTMSYGKTDADGSFRMQFSDTYDGVIPGDYRIRISTSDAAYDKNDRLIMTPEIIPDRYRDRLKSELTRTVEPGKHNHFDLELSGGPITQASSKHNP